MNNTAARSQLVEGFLTVDYPSGGLAPRVPALRRALAPSIDVIVPDIYIGGFTEICRAFKATPGRWLLIPKMWVNSAGIAQMFHAVSEYHAIGASPFGVDSLVSGSSHKPPLKDAYWLLRAVTRRLVDRQNAPIRGFRLTDESATSTLGIGGYQRDFRAGTVIAIGSPVLLPYGVVLETKPSSFLLAGRGIRRDCQLRRRSNHWASPRRGETPRRRFSGASPQWRRGWKQITPSDTCAGRCDVSHLAHPGLRGEIRATGRRLVQLQQ